MNLIQIQIQKDWLKLATDLLQAIEDNKLKQVLYPEHHELKKYEDEYTKQYNNAMEEVLKNHINIDDILIQKP